MNTSRLSQKVGASAVNCTLVMLLTLPLLPLLGLELWKLATIITFFCYNLVFRARCIGMRVMHTYIEPPTSPLYALLYTIGFASFFYSVFWPMDLLFVNGVAQVGSLLMTGNTLHGQIAGQATMSREQYLARAKACAKLVLDQGSAAEAVTVMENLLNKWPDLRQPHWVMKLGHILATDGTHDNVRAWIDGFQ